MKRLKTLTLIAILVVSIVGTPAMAASDTSGMVGVPDSNVMEDLPADSDVEISAADLEGSVMASSNAEGMELILTTPERAADYVNGSQIRGDDLALVFRDNSSHEGRSVAVPSDAIRSVYGYLPESVHGVHDSGEEWVRPTSGESGLLIFEVPKFSSNVVTFTGEATITSSGSTNGSTVSWELSDLDATSDPVINLTGKMNTEWDNVSASGVGLDHTGSLSVGGNTNPTDGSGGDSVLSVTAHAPSSEENEGKPYSGSHYVIGDQHYNGDEQRLRASTTFVANNDGNLNDITLDIKDAYGADYGPTVDIYLSQDTTSDGTWGEGTLIKSGWDPAWSTGNQTIEFSTPPTVSGGTEYEIEFITSGSNFNDDSDQLTLHLGNGTSGEYNLEVDDLSANTKHETRGGIWYNISTNVNDLSVSDGGGKTHTFGNLNDSETATTALGLTTSSTELDFTGTGGGVIDYTLTMQERTQTENSGVEFNNESTVSYSGTLADGETVQRTVNKSVLQEGTNQVEVSLPELSADAPAPQVAFEITHDAASDISADYASNGWREEYNVSTTYSTTKTGATLEVPFSSPVYKIPYLEESVDGDSWTAIPDDRYSLDGSTLTVQLDDGDSDGDVDGGTEYAVRVAGDKMDVRNGAVTITDPVEPGDSQLDVGVRIDSKQPGFEIGVGGTKNGHLIHYPYQESWSNPTGQAIVESGGAQYLEFPNAPEGGSTRITTVPLEIRPETGDASILIQDPDEPTFKIGPGGSTGDDLEIRYHDTTSGNTYELYSTSRSRTVGTDTAESPAIFEEDDSGETFEIRLQDDGTFVVKESGNMWPEPTPDSSIIRYGIVAGWLGLLVALAYGTGKASMRARTRWFLMGTATIGGGLLTLELLNPGSISERLGRVIESSLADLLPLAGLAAIGIVVYSIYSWWKKRQAEASTPETSVAFNLRGSKNE